MFKTHVDWKPEFTIKNSLELVKILENIEVPDNAQLVSLDMENMYTNVNRSVAFQCCRDILKSHSNLSDSEREQFIKLAEFTTENNYFCFQGKYYQLDSGLSMGAPISPLMSNIYMDKYDKLIHLLGEKGRKKILIYKRFYDDIFMIRLGTKREMDKLVIEANKLEPNLKFKVEFGGNKLDFLDLSLEIKNRRIKFKVYRKDSYSDAIIPKNSYHSWNHKMSAFNCMIHRLLNLPLEKQDFREELDTIISIAENNGYEKTDILRILRKKRQRRENQLLFNTGDQPKHGDEKLRSIPYSEGVSEKIKKIIRKRESCNVTYNNLTTETWDVTSSTPKNLMVINWS